MTTLPSPAATPHAGFFQDASGDHSAMRLVLILGVGAFALFGFLALALVVYVVVYHREALQGIAVALTGTGAPFAYVASKLVKYKAVQSGVEAIAKNPTVASAVTATLGKASSALQEHVPQLLATVATPTVELVTPTPVPVVTVEPFNLSSEVSSLSAELRTEIRELFDTAKIKPNKLAAVQAIAEKITANHARYQTVSDATGVPSIVIALIHSLEGSLSFSTHLHNGDPLKARTVHVPKGRPLAGAPPFSWEESAIDALKFDNFDKWKDWSIEGCLWELEKYNGLGSRRHGINTPYLWSFTTVYTKGKYVADGKYDPDAVSQQAGAAAILRVLVDNGTVTYS